MTYSRPTTLPELLSRRAQTSSGTIHFLDSSGKVTSSITLPELFSEARRIASALVSHGLKGGGTDIVVTNFDDQRNHILIFWGCCFAGIPICPAPPLHPDGSRRSLFLHHIQQLFHEPTFISDVNTLASVTELVQDFKTIDVTTILKAAIANGHSTHTSHIYPDRVTSPTETVVLMLTSGTTGNSKGVVLPHTVLLSAIKGKALKHGTVDTDAILNWINFDHVANVTDAHLHAIWAGATQYQVSPSTIIRNPGSLLELCSRYRITHTFSPNFLLAQICRDASTNSSTISTENGRQLDLSSLRIFNTGGEANPVSTAVEFSDLIGKFGAPRTTLRAAWGMTETAAGSIFNPRPILASVSDYGSDAYLSVGTPCVGTQVRVVDRETTLPCPPNIPGHLQVTGPSIFPHYYSNPRANSESFTTDGWFITGDTAILDEQGYLYMCGRDKHDININGVKHAGVDIELYLEDSNIPGLKPSFVFVSALRLDGADTETYAVFYEHSQVDIDAISKGGLTDDEIKEVLVTNRRIRSQCSIFCSQAPHVVLPLPPQNFIKTALGKVSRPLLVARYQQGKFAAVESYLSNAAASQQKQLQNGHAERSPTDNILCEWIADAFNVDFSTLSTSQNVLDLGASSMHLMRFQQFIKERFAISDISTMEMLKRPIISELSEYVQQLCGDANGVRDSQAYSPLVCLQPHGSKPPLYLVHPGAGEILVFINVARILDDDRPVYAFRAQGFEAGEVPASSVQEMVDVYTSEILKRDPRGPYFIGGYSFGGAIAFDIGKSLESRGLTVAWLGILNLPPFIQSRMKELVWVETTLSIVMFLGLVLPDDLDAFKAKLLDAYPDGNSDHEPQNSRQMIEWMFASCDQKKRAELNMSIEYFHRWAAVASTKGRHFEPSGAVKGALTTIFCAIPSRTVGTREEHKQKLSKWKDFSGQHFEMIDVDGEHYTMLSIEHVEAFTLKMKGAIHRAEALIKP